MTIYYLIGILIIAASCIEPGIISNSNRKKIFILLLFSLTLLSAFRYDVGMDYMEYYRSFKESVERNEKGFSIINDLFRCIFGKNVGFFVFIAVLSICILKCVAVFITKYSKNPLLSLLIFFCFGQYFFLTFNLLRQSVVIYIYFAFFIGFAIRKEIWRYSIGVLFLSYFFHATALILLPLYFFTRNISTWLKFVLIGFFITSQSVIITLIENSSYSIYLKMEMFSAEVTILQYFLFAISIIFSIHYITLKSRQSGNLSKLELFFENLNYLNLMFTISMIMFSGTPIMQVCSRLSFYSTPIYIVLIPNFIHRIKNIHNRVIFRYVTILVYSLIFTVALTQNGKTQHIVPYRTIFEVI